jgi:hypothetical protein
MDLREVEKRLEGVLSNAKTWLPEREVEEMLSLVKAGEPGVALENFCTQLEEYDIAVPRDVAVELRSLAFAMGMRASRWIDHAADA